MMTLIVILLIMIIIMIITIMFLNMNMNITFVLLGPAGPPMMTAGDVDFFRRRLLPQQSRRAGPEENNDRC